MKRNYSKEKLREVAGDDDDFMAIVAQTFLEEIPIDMVSLQEALDNNNKELVYQFTHKIKPNLEMLGINLSREIKSIQTWAKTSKRKKTIIPHSERLFKTLNLVFEEIKEDFAI